MGLTQGYHTINAFSELAVLLLDWFEWDCLRLENVNVVTQETNSSHGFVYI